MFGLFFDAFVLGLIGGAVPGPILTGTFTEILKSGLLKGLRVVFYALIAETVGALLAILIIYSLGLSAIALKIISITGALVLFWIAWSIWKIREINTDKKQIISFNKVMLLTAFNSGYWMFWITIGVSKALILDQIIFGGKFIFLAIFETAWLIMTVALAIIFASFRPVLHKNNLVGATFKFFALVIVFLAVKTLINIF